MTFNMLLHRKPATTQPPESAIPSPPDSTVSARSLLMRHASENSTDESYSPTPTKKIRYSVSSKPKGLNASQRTRKNPTTRTTTRTTNTITSRSTSTLVPRGERTTAKLNQNDESLLRMLCDDIVTGEVKELHFRNLPHSTIDWTNMNHINKINNWRNQIYGRAGIKSKAVTMWLPDEELWFELYYHLSIAEARARGILLPKTVDVFKAFNRTFTGTLLKDQKGCEVRREARKSNAFTSKFNRVCVPLRARLQQCVFGKSGDVYVPEISMEMLQVYKMMKRDMEMRGVGKESAHPEHLEEWRYLFSHLPHGKDGDVQDRSFTSEEGDAAAVLVSMALQPVRVGETIKTEGAMTATSFVSYPGHCAIRYETPELSRSFSIASSQRSVSLVTPSRTSSISSEGDIKLVGARGNLSRCVTPVQVVDLASLIMSPD